MLSHLCSTRSRLLEVVLQDLVFNHTLLLLGLDSLGMVKLMPIVAKGFLTVTWVATEYFGRALKGGGTELTKSNFHV